MNHLSVNEKKALKQFKELLAKEFPERFSEIKLFGSKARGEASKFSDVDVLVVLESSTWRDSWPIHQAASAVSLEFDVDLSVKIMTSEAVDHLRQRESPLIINIDRDGVAV